MEISCCLPPSLFLAVSVDREVIKSSSRAVLIKFLKLNFNKVLWFYDFNNNLSAFVSVVNLGYNNIVLLFLQVKFNYIQHSLY